MSLVTWWLRHRQLRQTGDELQINPGADELKWWKGERRRLLWKYALRQGVPMAATFTLGALLLAARKGHLGFGGIMFAIANGCVPGLLAGYFTATMIVGRHRALAIRQKRLRDAFLAPPDVTS